MPKKDSRKPEDYIVPLNINGLQGRMLRMPAPAGRKREILFIGGHHTSHERVFGVAEFLNKYGAVTVPDLPGFGGMQSFYRIGEKPTLDNMADYLAAFVKLRYQNKRLNIIATSYGFAVVTRMLQKYPEIVKKVDLLVSFAGTTHKDDFRIKKRTIFMLHLVALIVRLRLPALFLKYVIIRPAVIRLGYRLFEPMFIKNEHSKVRDDVSLRRQRVDFEIDLWQKNDLRTWAVASIALFKLDLTGSHVDLPVEHISISTDRYFNNIQVEQHMRAIYKNFDASEAKVPNHAPSVISTAKEVAPFVPQRIRRLMNKRV